MNATKEQALLREIIRETDAALDDGVSTYALEVVRRVRDIAQGKCPDSGYSFERCIETVCDCPWEHGLPWVDNEEESK